MNPQEITSDQWSTPVEKDGLKIDYRRVLYRAMRYWYFIVLSLAIALTIAFVRNRYAPRIYPVSTSIIFKEAEETGAGDLLYSNSLVQPYRNYFNELYIIRSYPLIQSVLEDLNFAVSFYREGNILTSEIYDYPVTARIINNDQVKSCSFNFKPISTAQYELRPQTEGKNQKPGVFSFNDTIVYQDIRTVFSIRNIEMLSSNLNSPVIFIYTAPEYLTRSYVNKLNASWAEKGSGVLNLSLSGFNPGKESDFLNGFIRRYQQYDLENKNKIATRTIDFINTQLIEISDSLSKVENNLQRFKGENIITDLGSETLRLYKDVENLELQRTEFILRENYYKYLTDNIQKESNLDLIILPSSVGISDPVLGQFITEMISLQLDLKMVVGREKLDNPLIRQKRERLQEIKNNIIESVKTQRGSDKIQQEFLSKRIKNVEKQLSGLPKAEREYISIRRNYSLLENLYIFLLQKRAEASISRASSISDITVINPPMAGSPISPKPEQNYMIATGVGLALPLAIFILLEIFNTRIQSKEDVEKYTKIPFIGGVGHKTSDDNRTVLQAPKSAVAESFRALRSNLTYFLGEGKNSIILITSSISGEGKTFSTINLATVLALSGKRTLIVGADLRKPKLFSDFNLNNEVGLSSYLAGISNFDQVVQHTGHEHLDIVSGGPVPPNPSELILTPRMEEFFKITKTRYDYIIVDSPPLAIVADAFVLAKYADHMVFLIRQNYTPKNMLKPVDDYYRSGRLKNVSVLLNDIYRSGPGYGYGYGYSYGYGYTKNGYGYYSEA